MMVPENNADVAVQMQMKAKADSIRSPRGVSSPTGTNLVENKNDKIHINFNKTGVLSDAESELMSQASISIYKPKSKSTAKHNPYLHS